MNFSSLLFLFAFLPAFFLFYSAAPSRIRDWVLLLASVFFYAWSAPRFIGLLIGTTLCDYLLALGISRYRERHRAARLLFVGALILELGCLFYFKYFNFFLTQASIALRPFGITPWPVVSMALPIGISFIVFQRISYLIDVFWKRIEPERSVFSFLLYVLMFAKLTQGPIMRYGAFSGQNSTRSHSLELTFAGIRRFCVGLAKKVLIADALGEIADPLFHMLPATLTLPYAWLGAIAYAGQIYFDFSGYTDMAIGLGNIMGFRLPENFNQPYLSKNVSDFWRRWHVSLSTWLRDYLFLPISYALMRRTDRERVLGMKTEMFVGIVATIATMFLAGLWHGASWNFVAWGLYYGFFLSLDRLWWLKRSQRLPRLVTIPITFLIILFGWVLFRSGSVGHAVSYMAQMFAVGTLWHAGAWMDVVTTRRMTALCVAALLCVVPAFDLEQRLGRIGAKLASSPLVPALQGIGSVLLLAWSTSSLANSSFHAFIYWRF